MRIEPRYTPLRSGRNVVMTAPRCEAATVNLAGRTESERDDVATRTPR